MAVPSSSAWTGSCPVFPSRFPSQGPGVPGALVAWSGLGSPGEENGVFSGLRPEVFNPHQSLYAMVELQRGIYRSVAIRLWAPVEKILEFEEEVKKGRLPLTAQAIFDDGRVGYFLLAEACLLYTSDAADE